MTLIEGIGDEVTHFFIGLLVVLVVTLAWWTTSISEQRHVQTVWLLDRRRHRTHRRLTNHTQAVTIAEGTATSTLPPDPPQIPVEASAKPPEASASTSTSDTREEASVADDQARIVEAMDTDASVLRQRRLAFYDRNVSNVEESLNEDHTIMEHNYAEAGVEGGEANAEGGGAESGRDIRIKLKYINDDLKLVDGKLKEQLGDFKKRHFQVELSSNKFVRLIFNGQVLQQDSKTLENCGFFDNCVVHCLIHPRRPTLATEASETRADQSQPHLRNTNQNNNNNQGREWDFGNFLFAIISFTLLSAWYFRYVYAHLYTVTATVGLILMTGVFTIVLFGFYFPDHHDHLPPRGETAPDTQST